METHSKVFDLLCLSNSPYNKINIHIGAVYDGSKEKTCDNFCRNFDRLSDNLKERLTIENDDKGALYSAKDIYDLVYKKIKTPIVFDFHHHKFCTGGQSEEDALLLSLDTWGGVTPVCHYSQSRSEEKGDPKIRSNAHSDSYWEPISFYNQKFDVMLEAKHKEIALFKMRQLLSNNPKQKEI